MRLFSGKSLDELREVSFEIGLDINDPEATHVKRSLPWRTLSVLDHYRPTFHLVRMNSQKLDPVINFSFQWTEIDNHDAVLIMLDYLTKGGDKLNPPLCSEVTAEDRVMNGISKGFHGCHENILHKNISGL
jgi:hypothetical protein